MAFIHVVFLNIIFEKKETQCYENLNRDFSLVYPFGAVLATGTRTDLSPSTDLVDPASVPDHWIFA